MGQNMVQQEERQRARRKGGNHGEGVSGERKGRVYNSWQKGHTYCREHTHTGPPGICRSLGRGRGRHLNPWLQCTGSDCCIWREKTQERNIHCFVQIHPVSSKLGNWRKSQKVDCSSGCSVLSLTGTESAVWDFLPWVIKRVSRQTEGHKSINIKALCAGSFQRLLTHVQAGKYSNSINKEIKRVTLSKM